MKKSEEYRKILQKLNNWDEYLKKESGLPGPRGNLELAEAVVEEGNQELFERYILFNPEKAPENTQNLFLAFCGVVGLGRLVSEGKERYLQQLRKFSKDPRWRIREGVAMALQRFGDKDMNLLINEMIQWSKGEPLEQRAAAAALCEPRLLKNEKYSKKVLDILDAITTTMSKQKDRKREEFIVLRKGMGYCWSVAVVASPEYGKQLMEKWIASEDKDIKWIMKENLKKNRIIRCDEKWVSKMNQKIK
jgi:hypothetical protein